MAARKHLSHDQKTRERIQTSQLINRLQSHVNGDVELTPAQVASAKILLGKSLPDLSAVQLSTDPDNPLVTVSKIELVPGAK